MAKEDKYADEKLSDDELEQVVGGSFEQRNKDAAFFRALGRECSGSDITVTNLFCEYGVKFYFNLGDNTYKFQGAYSYACHPRHAALGYVLAKMNYPGYNGQWWDLNYTRNFIREHISNDVL